MHGNAFHCWLVLFHLLALSSLKNEKCFNYLFFSVEKADTFTMKQVNSGEFKFFNERVLSDTRQSYDKMRAAKVKSRTRV